MQKKKQLISDRSCNFY